jgi:hypothetical protein
VLNPFRLRSIRATGRPARAFPLSVEWAKGGDGGDEQSWFGGQAEVRWRIEIDGAEPYEVQDTISAPGWTRPSHRGKGVLGVRWRPGRGLLPDLGLPCRVDPGDPEAVAIDWDAGYEEHARRWDELDGEMRHVGRRRGGFDGALDRVLLRGAPAPDPQRAAELDRAVQEARVAEASAEETAWTVAAPVAAGIGEREMAAADIADAKWLRKNGVRTPARIIGCEDTGRRLVGLPVWRISGELDGARVAEQRIAMAERSTRRFRPGAQVTAWVDPANPARVTFF